MRALAVLVLVLAALLGCGSGSEEPAVSAVAVPAPSPSPAMYCVPLTPELCVDIWRATDVILPGCEEALRY